VERWKPIPGYEDTYSISDLGRVLRHERLSRDGKRRLPEKIMTCSNSRGYRVVALNRKLTGVHRLVCLAFNGPAPEGMNTVRHLNDVPADNRPENLAWGTQADNMADCIRLGNHNRRWKK
jgi:HNH endonuclease/NUMOD4 motif